MPTYQYACTQCDERLEAVQSFSDPALTVCPACEGRLRKVFSAVGVVFKGSGFYKTDSRGGSGDKSAAEAGSGKDGGGKDGSKDAGATTAAKDGGGGAKAGGGAKESSSGTSAAASSGSSSTPVAKSA